ncbi:mechanosensitive ion channel family protein [Acuticoccus mangrovi]|uniref:Small-conductance mechanosensitive channel n=1 Tax=Acuticoccus mangrovi TaxID=2796142 RepID=A0A934MIL0_9HYPH|nr:mechanosensitive ion channel family protein [Acuticoccus mangrovi]MBJ3777296.1 mechanosensitive ion channel family protein [Acuticoccus mangrovi]
MEQIEHEGRAFLDGIYAWMTVQGINILVGILILIIGFWLSRMLKRALAAYLSRTSHVDPIVESFLASLAYYGFLAILLIVALNLMGVQTASLIAVLGAASLAVGLALQGSLSSLAAGVMIIVMRPFKIGDYIEVSGEAGTVKSINLFLTELATYDNVQKLMPNAQVWNATVTNYSVYSTRLLDIEVSIDYGDPIDTALETLRAIATENPKVLAEPAPDAFVSGMGESSVDLTLRIWVPASDYWPLKRLLTKTAKEEIEAKGMSIPYPHRQIIMPTPPASETAPDTAAGTETA